MTAGFDPGPSPRESERESNASRSNPAETGSGRQHPVIAVLFRICVSLLVLAAGVGAGVMLTVTAPVPNTVDRSNQATPVMTIVPKIEPIARRWRGFGTMKPALNAMVPSRVASTVIEVPDLLEVGVPVVTGQVLVRLDAEDYQRQAEAAGERLVQIDAEIDRLDTEYAASKSRLTIVERALELSESDLQRVRDARAKGAALPREIDAAEQQVLTARRSLVTIQELIDTLPVKRRILSAQRDQLVSDQKIAESQVARCEIVAPFDGVVAAVMVEVGEQVGPGSPVVRIFDPSVIELPLRIPASARGRVGTGDRVMINRTVGDRPIEAVVDRLSPEDDAGSRTMTVFVEIDSRDGAVVPGLFVRGEVVESDSTPRSIVPRRSVVNQRVMLVEDGKIGFERVRTSFPLSGQRPSTGLEDEQWLVLESTLPEGARVVVDGARDLEEGMAVEPRSPEGLDESAVGETAP
ncbi:MAG: hypothetical protein CMJ51_06145 [Planctomycetaceae bacterium]|nr:hypothetical protein [Planctomycetaceae bacterium]